MFFDKKTTCSKLSDFFIYQFWEFYFLTIVNQNSQGNNKKHPFSQELFFPKNSFLHSVFLYQIRLLNSIFPICIYAVEQGSRTIKKIEFRTLKSNFQRGLRYYFHTVNFLEASVISRQNTNI